MKKLSDHKIEFIAKTLADLGKAFMAVGLASYFFEKFGLVWRLVFGFFSVAMILSGIYLYPNEGGEE